MCVREAIWYKIAWQSVGFIEATELQTNSYADVIYWRYIYIVVKLDMQAG